MIVRVRVSCHLENYSLITIGEEILYTLYVCIYLLALNCPPRPCLTESVKRVRSSLRGPYDLYGPEDRISHTVLGPYDLYGHDDRITHTVLGPYDLYGPFKSLANLTNDNVSMPMCLCLRVYVYFSMSTCLCPSEGRLMIQDGIHNDI